MSYVVIVVLPYIDGDANIHVVPQFSFVLGVRGLWHL